MLDPPFNSDCITFKGASMSALPDVPRTVRSNSFGELKKKGKKKKKTAEKCHHIFAFAWLAHKNRRKQALSLNGLSEMKL